RITKPNPNRISCYAKCIGKAVTLGGRPRESHIERKIKNRDRERRNRECESRDDLIDSDQGTDRIRSTDGPRDKGSYREQIKKRTRPFDGILFLARVHIEVQKG